jgi:glycosyltransferase involved in cell wall biosynthesis
VKILIVTPYFPPQNAIASLRPYSWAKWWSRGGNEIIVYTTMSYGVKSNLNLKLPNLEIHEIPIPFVQKLLISYNGKEEKGNKKNDLKQEIVIFIRNIYRAISDSTGCILGLRYPDLRDLWVGKVLKFVKKNKFDVVVTTGGPYSVHKVGYVLKKKSPNIFWVMDWRDLWTKNHVFMGLKIFHPYERYLENKYHKKANLITTVSDPLADTLRTMTRTRVETIYNGFDFEDYQQIKLNPRQDNTAFTIVYTGTIYRGFRDPSPLFEAISRLKQKELIDSSNLSVHFAGTNADVSDMAEKFNISDCYKYLGFLPREDALQIQYDADAVLFLEYNKTEAHGILTGKLFEYLSLAREIWAVGISSLSGAGQLIESACAGICFENDVEKIEKYLISSLSNRRIGKKNKNQELIASFDRKVQAERLFSLIYKQVD